MESFKIWIISICGASAVTSVFKILLSSSTLKKALNIFFSLFILFYTVIPIGNFTSEKKIIKDTSENDIRYDQFYEDGYRGLVEQSIKNVCANLSIKVLSVQMESYIDSEGYLNIESLEIETDSPGRSAEIKEYIKKQLGFEVSVS